MIKKILPFLFMSSFAFGGSNSLPVETARVIQLSHVNKFQTALSGDLLPRDVNGNLVDGSSDFGASSYRWANIYTKNLKLTYGTSTNSVILTAPSGVSSPYTLTFPTALPASLSRVTVATDGTITFPVMGYTLSSSSAGFSSTSNTYVDVTNLSVTLVTTGRPVVITLIPDGSNSQSDIDCLFTSSAGQCQAFFQLLKDGAGFSNVPFVTNPATGTSGYYYAPPGSVTFIDVPTAASHTYKLQAKVFLANTTVGVNYCKLIAYEL